ncbi:bis(5'-nucleosyl)-tetraphosphatase (symmetrical) YqeK [Paenibacillus thermotolerans]|uniref:bis(5'-nucleosyl)-tetraphosphatase (symmetrical) YqeK n=1 Tax=Paenibacillus thermotolerans TaxID=3027807 RepID=UPI0023689EBE|nr:MULTISPECIES: bis(5'-nucleosyl)-tetraphosphatase (symmetrical) YqeK [unclassified Paenibacillus]
MKHRDLIDRLMSEVSKQMPERRWKHTLGVVSSAMKLAERYGDDPEKAELAAVLHDVAKFWPVDKQRDTIMEEGLHLDVLDYDKELWHAHAGAYVARRDYGVADAEVLNAIRYHTSGRVGMSRLEKIICLADYIEPGREFPGVDNLRRLSEESLEEALLAGFDGTISFLMEKRKRIYPLTVLTRNDLILSLTQEA